MMTLGEMFSGIGGWSEAAKMAGGIRPVWCSEIDSKKNNIYELRHPTVLNIGDIQAVETAPYADIITVSFPCTGISVAGKGEGLKDVHSRLWFDAERVIGNCKPKYVVIENGPILTQRGLDRILAALSTFGYDAEWTNLSGYQFGIQQRRKRLFLVAYPRKSGFQGEQHTGAIFRQIKARGGVQPTCIYPGWAGRWDIPEPRTYGSAYDIPGGVHRLVGTGDAIIPVIGMYVLECIKRHFNQ